VVRLRNSPDIDELVDLASRIRAADGYPLYLPEGGLRRFLTDPSPLAAWVAEDAGRIVGHVAANSHSHRAVMDLVRTAGIDRQVSVIARLLVDPGVRRQGIGAKLLDQARSHIVSWASPLCLMLLRGPHPRFRSTGALAGWRLARSPSRRRDKRSASWSSWHQIEGGQGRDGAP
jgi:GNAT superfamily N-acetyltransferase